MIGTCSGSIANATTVTGSQSNTLAGLAANAVTNGLYPKGLYVSPSRGKDDTAIRNQKEDALQSGKMRIAYAVP